MKNSLQLHVTPHWRFQESNVMVVLANVNENARPTANKMSKTVPRFSLIIERYISFQNHAHELPLGEFLWAFVLS